jgi:predicted nucleic acid-binding protein
VRFWDSSAIVPLCIREPSTNRLKEILQDDPSMTVWWATPVEMASALARRRRENPADTAEYEKTRERARFLARGWNAVSANARVRELAMRLLRVHALRAGDALQLAAALVWAEDRPSGREFVCLDERLRETARLEGFDVVPALGVG